MSDTTTPPLAAQGKGPFGPLRALLSSYGIFLLLPVLLLLGGVISPSFVSASNISNLLLRVAPLGIVAIGQSLFQGGLRGVQQLDGEAGEGRDMGDSVAHLAGADNADGFDLARIPEGTVGR